MRKSSVDVVRELWIEHFPKRKANAWSGTLCLAFCLTVEEVAGRQASADDDLVDKVHEVLVAIGIPRDEFYQMEREIEAE